MSRESKGTISGNLYGRLQKRHVHRVQRQAVHHRGIPAREARQGRRVRAHEAARTSRRAAWWTTRSTAGTKFDSVRLETKKMQYLYNDGADFNFMDNDTYEQVAISAEMVGEAAKWLKENDEATLLYAGDELISIEPQMFVELEVTAHRARLQGRHGHQHHEARDAGDGCGAAGSHVRRDRRRLADRHARRPRDQARCSANPAALDAKGRRLPARDAAHFPHPAQRSAQARVKIWNVTPDFHPFRFGRRKRAAALCCGSGMRCRGDLSSGRRRDVCRSRRLDVAKGARPQHSVPVVLFAAFQCGDCFHVGIRQHEIEQGCVFPYMVRVA